MYLAVLLTPNSRLDRHGNLQVSFLGYVEHARLLTHRMRSSWTWVRCNPAPWLPIERCLGDRANSSSRQAATLLTSTAQGYKVRTTDAKEKSMVQVLTCALAERDCRPLFALVPPSFSPKPTHHSRDRLVCGWCHRSDPPVRHERSQVSRKAEPDVCKVKVLNLLDSQDQAKRPESAHLP